MKLKEAEALRNEAKLAASNILNITLDNVISQTVIAEPKPKKKKKKKRITIDEEYIVNWKDSYGKEAADDAVAPNPRQGLVMDKIPGPALKYYDIRTNNIAEGMAVEYIYKGKKMTRYI